MYLVSMILSSTDTIKKYIYIPKTLESRSNLNTFSPIEMSKKQFFDVEKF